MGLNDCVDDCQSHPHAAILCREKRLENLVQKLRLNSWTGIGYRELGHAIVAQMGRTNGDLTIALASSCERFDSVCNQVEDNLLQLNTVTFHHQRKGGELRDQSNVMCRGLNGHNSKHFASNFVQVDIPSIETGFGEKTTQSFDDLACPKIGTPDIGQNRFEFL